MEDDQERERMRDEAQVVADAWCKNPDIVPLAFRPVFVSIIELQKLPIDFTMIRLWAKEALERNLGTDAYPFLLRVWRYIPTLEKASKVLMAVGERDEYWQKNPDGSITFSAAGVDAQQVAQEPMIEASLEMLEALTRAIYENYCHGQPNAGAPALIEHTVVEVGLN